MRHVLDLDGDWFATEPVYPPCTHRGPCDFPGVCSGTPDPVCPVAVGDVLANVRTEQCHYNDAGHACCDDAPAWADPPFVQVAEVLPIMRDHQRKPYVLPTVGGRSAWVVRKSHPDRLIDLDPQPLGGWAVRVEALNIPYCVEGFVLQTKASRPPVVDGPPLNEEAQQ